MNIIFLLEDAIPRPETGGSLGQARQNVASIRKNVPGGTQTLFAQYQSNIKLGLNR
jgi:hypothetical protein